MPFVLCDKHLLRTATRSKNVLQHMGVNLCMFIYLFCSFYCLYTHHLLYLTIVSIVLTVLVSCTCLKWVSAGHISNKRTELNCKLAASYSITSLAFVCLCVCLRFLIPSDVPHGSGLQQPPSSIPFHPLPFPFVAMSTLKSRSRLVKWLCLATLLPSIMTQSPPPHSAGPSNRFPVILQHLCGIIPVSYAVTLWPSETIIHECIFGLAPSCRTLTGVKCRATLISTRETERLAITLCRDVRNLIRLAFRESDRGIVIITGDGGKIYKEIMPSHHNPLSMYLHVHVSRVETIVLHQTESGTCNALSNMRRLK